jgi:thiol:disulfide interchange protein DsbD
METLRNLMGFPLIATVVWLAALLESQAGARAMTILLVGLAAAGCGAWIWGRWGRLDRSRRARAIAMALSLLLACGAIAVAAAGARVAATADTSGIARERGVDGPWETWTPERLAELRRQGAPVFVDFSAKWCLTCRLNEATTLENRRVVERFQALGVVLLKADWTERNDSIAEALAGLGRAGVPVYALYGRGAQEPTLLPEILTPKIVLEALERMR